MSIRARLIASASSVGAGNGANISIARRALSWAVGTVRGRSIRPSIPKHGAVMTGSTARRHDQGALDAEPADQRGRNDRANPAPGVEGAVEHAEHARQHVFGNSPLQEREAGHVRPASCQGPASPISTNAGPAFAQSPSTRMGVPQRSRPDAEDEGQPAGCRRARRRPNRRSGRRRRAQRSGSRFPASRARATGSTPPRSAQSGAP